MKLEDRIFLALYEEYNKNLPNMNSITEVNFGISKDELYIALEKLAAKNVITRAMVSKNLNGEVMCLSLGGVKLRSGADEYYRKIIQEYDVPESKNKIFISHSSIDAEYVKLIVELLEFIGVRKGDLFCTSVPGYGIPLGKNIDNALIEQFRRYNILFFIVLSPNYRKSETSHEEIGAARLSGCRRLNIWLPGVTLRDIPSSVDSREIALNLGADIYEVRARLNELYKDVINFLNKMPVDNDRWEYYREQFIQKIHYI